jgi:hypothetical protein
MPVINTTRVDFINLLSVNTIDIGLRPGVSSVVFKNCRELRIIDMSDFPDCCTLKIKGCPNLQNVIFSEVNSRLTSLTIIHSKNVVELDYIELTNIKDVTVDELHGIDLSQLPNSVITIIASNVLMLMLPSPNRCGIIKSVDIHGSRLMHYIDWSKYLMLQRLNIKSVARHTIAGVSGKWGINLTHVCLSTNAELPSLVAIEQSNKLSRRFIIRG